MIHDYIISTKDDSYITIVDTHEVHLHNSWDEALAHIEIKRDEHAYSDRVNSTIIERFINK